MMFKNAAVFLGLFALSEAAITRKLSSFMSEADIQKIFDAADYPADAKDAGLWTGGVTPSSLLDRLVQETPINFRRGLRVDADGNPSFQIKTMKETTDLHVDDGHGSKDPDTGVCHLQKLDEPQASTLMFLNTNEEAYFLHGEEKVPVVAGTLVNFQADEPHQTVVNRGLVQIMVPFTHRQLMPCNGAGCPYGSAFPSDGDCCGVCGSDLNTYCKPADSPYGACTDVPNIQACNPAGSDPWECVYTKIPDCCETNSDCDSDNCVIEDDSPTGMCAPVPDCPGCCDKNSECPSGKCINKGQLNSFCAPVPNCLFGKWNPSTRMCDCFGGETCLDGFCLGTKKWFQGFGKKKICDVPKDYSDGVMVTLADGVLVNGKPYAGACCLCPGEKCDIIDCDADPNDGKPNCYWPSSKCWPGTSGKCKASHDNVCSMPMGDGNCAPHTDPCID